MKDNIKLALMIGAIFLNGCGWIILTPPPPAMALAIIGKPPNCQGKSAFETCLRKDSPRIDRARDRIVVLDTGGKLNEV